MKSIHKGDVSKGTASLRSPERGLKFLCVVMFGVLNVVAPFAGAWIEILISLKNCTKNRSLRSPERGLKSYCPYFVKYKNRSLRSPERGLK